ncbi:electron transfer flavoprotein subunit alpha [Ameyamaea chiangmaiensis NBRC 103196]|uniref:Electron transfer flavoprotein subunit alpha/FixB family protein n=1 Tax=Ameyamaea chiangmaiensis TaxID=442969 RepID=A0A850PDF7_9PROT|nr:electron transfer flavoprotein subunit alpha/FixB family protein [Ameyamaea chiangmaiensis]MBS4076071.1 electron transfer flavoprotein subunit alpha/FixB family protein [Ameyamaea chiangmaiensis]NVN42038.1 electron transfer flavoprotein subunit alpha/FixB family protein [Ameyamaea chiangmaiensis]GBQ66904.1 electron transfer flavoprotein subunit alpha [Ameyamaea chiangmaiensis NBRC 103196]
MTARIRRDPRAERSRCLVPGGERPRLVRDGNVADMVVPSRPREASVRRIEMPAFWVVAVVEAVDGRLDRWGRQLAGAARMLAGADGGVVLIGLGDLGDAEGGEAGADRVLAIGGLADPEVTLGMLMERGGSFDPRHWVFAESGSGADLARRLAARNGWSIQPGIEALTVRQSIRPCRGGRYERVDAVARIVTLPCDRVAAYAGEAHEGRRLEEAAPHTQASDRLVFGPVTRAAAGDVPLSEAPFVVSAGQGVTDFDAFHAVARALGATEGASRVVCDAGLMPRAAQVGASGTVLDARCYLAFGIAGAPQHLQGLGKVEHVVAVNTDLHAAIIARAGLSIVADAQAVMPALLALLREEGA